MRKQQKTIIFTDKALKVISEYEKNKNISFNKAVNEIVSSYEKTITSKQLKNSLESIENILNRYITNRKEYIIIKN